MAEKKNIFDKAIDALTDRDEKAAAAEAAAKAAADKLAAEKAAASKAIADKAAADKAAAEKAAQIANAQREIAARAAAAAAAARAAQPKKGTVLARSLHIRKEHNSGAAEVGGLVKGNEVTILETWSDGKNTWARLGPDQWAAIVYNGETYIELKS